MKKILFLLLCYIHFGYAQNYQSVEEVNTACSQLGFAGDEDALIAIDEILDKIGLFRNFIIQECPDINNAVAKNIENASGQKERYILYDANFFTKIEDNANNDWAAISILAHEIGHHLNGHALNDSGSTHKWELEADYFSGTALAKMGASLDDAQSAIQTLKYEKASSTHPAKADRLAMIEKGWNKANGITKVISEEESDEEKALGFYEKGEVAFKNKNYSEAHIFFNKAKDLGIVDAYFYLSYSYMWGLGVKINYDKAYEYAKKGYEEGSIPSTYFLGMCLYEGWGVEQDDVAANNLFNKDFQVNWFKKQYNKKRYPIYASTIALMYHAGYGGVDQDWDNAFLWYKQAASIGDVLAQSLLAAEYLYGISIEIDYNKAYEYGNMSSNDGFANGQIIMGLMYYNGLGIDEDKEKGSQFLIEAAKQGHFLAEELLNEYGVKW